MRPRTLRMDPPGKQQSRARRRQRLETATYQKTIWRSWGVLRIDLDDARAMLRTSQLSARRMMPRPEAERPSRRQFRARGEQRVEEAHPERPPVGAVGVVHGTSVKGMSNPARCSRKAKPKFRLPVGEVSSPTLRAMSQPKPTASATSSAPANTIRGGRLAFRQGNAPPPSPARRSAQIGRAYMEAALGPEVVQAARKAERLRVRRTRRRSRRSSRPP